MVHTCAGSADLRVSPLSQPTTSPVSTLWRFFGDAENSYYPEYPCESGPVADNMGYHEVSCKLRRSPVMESWNIDGA